MSDYTTTVEPMERIARALERIAFALETAVVTDVGYRSTEVRSRLRDELDAQLTIRCKALLDAFPVQSSEWGLVLALLSRLTDAGAHGKPSNGRGSDSDSSAHHGAATVAEHKPQD